MDLIKPLYHMITMTIIMITIIIIMNDNPSGGSDVKQVKNETEGPVLPICYPKSFLCDGAVDCIDRDPTDEDHCPIGSVSDLSPV